MRVDLARDIDQQRSPETADSEAVSNQIRLLGSLNSWGHPKLTDIEFNPLVGGFQIASISRIESADYAVEIACLVCVMREED